MKPFPVRKLSLNHVTADPGVQPRANGLHGPTVDEYAAAMAGTTPDASDFPPVVVYHDTAGSNWLSEGFHRHAAAKAAGWTHLVAEIRPGGRRDAIANACGSNARHGLRRTNADKRRAVELLLGEFPGWSDRRVAEAAAVSNAFVTNIRPDIQVLTINTSSDGQPSESTVVGADGKAYRQAPKPPEPQPSESPPVDLFDIPAGSDAPPPGSDPEPADDPVPDPRAEYFGQDTPPGVPEPDAVSDAGTPDGGEGEAVADPDPAAEFCRRVNRLCSALDRTKAEVTDLKADPFSVHVHFESVVHAIESARRALHAARPTEPCPYCPAAPKPDCRGCLGTGRTTAARANNRGGARQ